MREKEFRFFLDIIDLVVYYTWLILFKKCGQINHVEMVESAGR